MSIKYFVSSDIHSYYTLWMEALLSAGFDKDNTDHRIIVCGDLFDRGDETKQCFDFAKYMYEQGRLIYVRGNHEDLLFKCISQINSTSDIDLNHILNGTLKTVVHFTNMNIYDLICGCYNRKEFQKDIDKLLEFVSSATVDFFELGQYIFVHGWVPCDMVRLKMSADKELVLADRNTWSEKWSSARWLNGMKCWSKGLVPDNTTVVCGHWHTSYGHVLFHGHREEFPKTLDKSSIESFKPFIEPGIIALDGCTAYTGLVNVAVFDVDDEGNILLYKKEESC